MKGRALTVGLHAEAVGHLWGDETHTNFSFLQRYLDAPDRSVLGQYFEDRLHKTTRRVRGMHPWFENLLPEHGGALRGRFARALGIDPDDSFALLQALGADLPGAVQVADDGDEPTDESRVVDEHPADVLATTRFSLGGVQLKFSMSGDPARLTLGVLDDSRDQWILKIGSPAFPRLAENEHAIMSWCRASGFDVPETRVVDVGVLPDLGALPETPTGFLVRRYDRVPGGRVHQEDFAQVLSVRPGRKYDAIDAAGLVDLSGQILGRAGAEETIRRLAVVVATGNADAHLKNWSLVYLDRVQASWSPLYDQVATIAYPSIEHRLALRIGHAKHMNEVRLDHLKWVGEHAGLEGGRVEELVRETLTALAATFRQLDCMPDDLAAVLSAHWETVPMLSSYHLE
ncbi:MAG: HipA domain-containing protein [Myxococcota bacterium]